MKNGYYLSVYTHIDELAHLNQIDLRHDHHMALWRKDDENIDLVHYWEFERLSGLKHHNRSFYNVDHAQQVINELLHPYELTLDDMEEVWGTPGLATSDDYHTLGEYPEYAYHSLAHLFSCIMLDSDRFYNSKIIGLAVDGGPDNVVDLKAREKDFYVGAFCDQGKIKLMSVPSPGILWLLMKLRFKLQEGSLMALGSASTSQSFLSIEELMEDLMPVQKGSDVYQASDWLKNLWEKIEKITPADEGVLFNGFDDRFSEMDNKISMVVKIVQEISFRIMGQTIELICEENDVEPSETYLALSGGFTLNCPSNSYLMKKYNFKGFLAPPCVSDTGIALGMGLYAFNQKMPQLHFKFKNAFYGDRDENLQEVLKSEEFQNHIASVTEMTEAQFVSDLKTKPLLWFNGRSEIGPRALGDRSILANPCDTVAKDELNRIKERQWWRPVAPIILEEHVHEWFEEGYASPYMLHTFQIKPEKRELVPAILHLDDSARIQTVNAEQNPEIYQVMQAFYRETGVPIICNTSLNDKGEPIINQIPELLNFALRKGVEIVYINKQRVALKNFDQYQATAPHKRTDIFTNYLSPEEMEAKKQELNPFDLSVQELTVYYNLPELQEYDLSCANDVKTLRRMLELMKGKTYHDMDIELAW